MDIKLGMLAKLYYCLAGIGGTPSWTELSNVKNLTLSVQKGEADGTTRANSGWKAIIGALKEGAIEFEMVWNTTDAGFTAMKNSFFLNTPIGIACMDGPITTPGNQGLWANMEVMNFSREEPLDGPITVKVSIKPTYSANAPQWYTVPGTTAATGTITLGDQPADANTVTIGDGALARTFEFDSDSHSETRNTAVTIGVSAAATATALKTAINASGLSITATDNGSGVVSLTNTVVGAAGNVPILKTGTNITVSGMAGGV